MSENFFLNLRDRLREFAIDRDWEKFHSPKNLVMALASEVGELIEHFQWLTEEESKSLPETKLSEVEQELADIFIYLVRLCDKLGINLTEATFRKIKINSEKYPIDRVRSSAKKYTEY
jgi:NTP pyrophosphatase (non-canonical NTP hydrolase)